MLISVQHLNSLDLPELAPYRTMRLQEDHRKQGLFVAEGEKVVRRLLESRFTVVSVLLPEKWFHTLEPLLQSRPEGIRAYLAPKEQLEKLTGFTMYQGLLAVGRIPELPDLDRLLHDSPSPRLFAAADGLSSAENLGVLVRNCAAFGVQALLVGETCASPYLRRAVRSSMGTIFRLPAVEVSCLAESLRKLRRHGIRCVAAHPHVEGRTLSESSLTGDCCLVFGSEGFGIAPAVLEACDEVAAIPMQGGVDSLNVASASAAFLYEAARQRGTG
jgi:tRNA G18 (ribose-2'-O)-methylase SpoU